MVNGWSSIVANAFEHVNASVIWSKCLQPLIGFGVRVRDNMLATLDRAATNQPATYGILKRPSELIPSMVSSWVPQVSSMQAIVARGLTVQMIWGNHAKESCWCQRHFHEIVAQFDFMKCLDKPSANRLSWCRFAVPTTSRWWCKLSRLVPDSLWSFEQNRSNILYISNGFKWFHISNLWEINRFEFIRCALHDAAPVASSHLSARMLANDHSQALHCHAGSPSKQLWRSSIPCQV